jgi:squalene-associated FAD-dependent desaturase
VRVAVVGGGWAGLAAAIALQERRHEVTLLERRGVLGGRATSYRDASSGEDVDNGTHLMVGAYHDTLDLVRRAGASELLLEQKNLRIDWVDEKGLTSLDCPPLAAPLHLLAGLLSLRVPWSVRFQALRFGLAVRFGRPPVGLTLAEYFSRTGQGEAARRLLWDPLALAILNESPDCAAAVLFHRVYREAFLADHRASRLVFLRRGWGVLAERLAEYFEGRGGRLRRRGLASAVVVEGDRTVGIRCVQRPPTREEIRAGRPSVTETITADAVVLAVPWHAVSELLPDSLRAVEPFASASRLRPSPIVSIEVWLDRVVLDRAMVGLRDEEVEWVFDKGRLYGREGPPQHLAFIVSAAARSAPRRNEELVGAAERALRRFFPAMAGAMVVRSLVMREPAATFASDPEAETLRPAPSTPVAGLYLAGDWTATGLPATIEGAVRSGRAAARAVESGA